jgi:hypothetical protein
MRAAAAAAAAEVLALAESAAAAAGAEAVAELRRQGFLVSARGRVQKLAPSDGWQTTAAAVARRVVEDEQEDPAPCLSRAADACSAPPARQPLPPLLPPETPSPSPLQAADPRGCMCVNVLAVPRCDCHLLSLSFSIAQLQALSLTYTSLVLPSGLGDLLLDPRAAT